MLTPAWLAAAADAAIAWRGKTCGIAYTHTFNRNPEDIWYDRLGTEVPSYVAGGLRALGIDAVYLNVDQTLEVCLSPVRRDSVQAIFNVCLGFLSLDNWALIPAACSWAGIPVLPNGAHAAILGEDKSASKHFARMAGFATADEWAESGKGVGTFVVKPRGLGSSVGLRLAKAHELPDDDPSVIVEPFVPGCDVTITLLFDPAEQSIRTVGALVVEHEGQRPGDTLWTEVKKSQGASNEQIRRSYAGIAPDLELGLKRLARSLNVVGAARVDFRLPGAPDGLDIQLADVVFLEINPCPTPSPRSSFGRTIDYALRFALERAEADSNDFWRGMPSEAFAVASLLASINAK